MPLLLGTENVEEVACKVGDRYVILVDTPGFNDSTRSDTEILGVLADWMQESYSDNLLLSGIIYLHCISDTRMTDTSIQNLRMFRKLCGDKNLQHVILATTKWGITPEGDALRREEELKSANGFWAPMIAGRSLIRRFENTKESARALVEEILHLGQEPFVPKIQEEVVSGMKLLDTEAGAYLNKALLELSEKHEKEKKALKEKMELAQKERKRNTYRPILVCLAKFHVENQQMLDALRVEYLRLWKDIARKEEDQRILHQSNIEALNERIRILEERKKTQGSKISVNEQKLWRVSWTCLECKHRTSRAGFWFCPCCGLHQWNQKWTQ